MDMKLPSWATDMGEDEFGIWALYKLGDVVQRMRWIPPGDYIMGAPEKQIPTTIDKGFWIGDTPVTTSMWDEMLKATDITRLLHEDAPRRLPIEPGHKNDPQTSISWNDVDMVLNGLGIPARMPTEEEWEYAARAGTTGEWYHEDLDKIAWYAENSGGHVHPVGEKLPNSWGLYDMLGNVWEWCSTIYK